MRYDKGHREQTRQRVLAEAATAIRAGGTERVGIAEVMAKAGLTHGGFYAHFKSKDELVAHSITQMFDESYQRFLTAAGQPDPARALTYFIDNYLSVRHRDAPERGCPMPSLSGEVARLSPLARERFQAGLDRLTHSIATLLTALGHADAGDLATSVIAELVGALTLSRAVDDRTASNRLLAASREALKARIGGQRA